MKTAVRHHLIPVRAPVTGSQEVAGWRGCGEKGTLLQGRRGRHLVQPLWLSTQWQSDELAVAPPEASGTSAHSSAFFSCSYGFAGTTRHWAALSRPSERRGESRWLGGFQDGGPFHTFPRHLSPLGSCDFISVLSLSETRVPGFLSWDRRGASLTEYWECGYIVLAVRYYS